jgi:hypothetical protein
LLTATNRLLRWYRAVTGQAEVIELTQAAASPFTFALDAGGPWGGDPLTYGAEVLFHLMPEDQVAAAVRAGLVGGGEPDVADLFLLDADEARRAGRFREAVLLSWSTIDAVFNRRYDELVDVALAGEPRGGRDFFKSAGGGERIPLKQKMGAALFLLTGRSFTREAWWNDLSTSYVKRNKIIHEGEGADEADANRALEVARHVVAFMRAPGLAPLPHAPPPQALG